MKMKTKIITAGIVSSTLLFTSLAGASFMKGDFQGGKHFGFNKNISLEQKEALKNMTQEERHAFMQEQKEISQKAMQSREDVIDKLLAGETLNKDEKEVVEEIKTQRLTQKQLREEMEAKRQEMMEKMKSGDFGDFEIFQTKMFQGKGAGKMGFGKHSKNQNFENHTNIMPMQKGKMKDNSQKQKIENN